MNGLVKAGRQNEANEGTRGVIRMVTIADEGGLGRTLFVSVT